MKLKIFIYLFLLLIGLPTIAEAKDYVALYNIPLRKVETRSSSINKEYEDDLNILVDDNGIVNSTFEDENIQIIWRCDGKRFWFTLLNKTAYPITIDWDNINFIDINSEANRVIHKGIKYIERNNAQLKTVVPRQSKISDFLVPSKNCVFHRGGYFGGAEWVENYLYPCVYKKKKDMNDEGPNLVNNSMRIDFPIEINGETYSYSFEFLIKDYVIQK